MVDHQPLVEILCNCRLDESDNPRMFRLKQHTLMWHFRILYRPGKKKDSADVISIHPNPYTELASLAMQLKKDSWQCTVFWPGLSKDIKDVRLNCTSCHCNTSSQPPCHPTPPDLPEVPFEMICSDYFKLHGKYHLIIGDRLSGLTEMLRWGTHHSTPHQRGEKY